MYNRPGWGITDFDCSFLTSCSGEVHEWRANENRHNLGDGDPKSALPGSLPRASWTEILPIPHKQTWGARSLDFLALSLTIFSGLNTLSKQLLPAVWRARGLAPPVQAASSPHWLPGQRKGNPSVYTVSLQAVR